jgi:hypothetical protein
MTNKNVTFYPEESQTDDLLAFHNLFGFGCNLEKFLSSDKKPFRLWVVLSLDFILHLGEINATFY